MNCNIVLSSLVQKSASQVSCPIDEAVVALSVEKGTYFQIDSVGRVIWEMLDQPISVLEICERLCSEFEVGRIQCESETISFLSSLEESGLLTINEGPSR